MDLVNVDKLAKNKDDVKYLLIRHNLSDRTVDAKRMKAKDSKEILCALLSMTRKNIPLQSIWVEKGTEVVRE